VARVVSSCQVQFQAATIFAQRLAGHSVARIARALNEAGVPCPSAADPGRNRHRSVAGVDVGRGDLDPGESPVYGPSGVDPAADRQRPGRPRQRGSGSHFVMVSLSPQDDHVGAARQLPHTWSKTTARRLIPIIACTYTPGGGKSTRNNSTAAFWQQEVPRSAGGGL